MIPSRPTLTRGDEITDAKPGNDTSGLNALVLPAGANLGPGIRVARRAVLLVLWLIGYVGFWLLMLFKPVKGA
jgi:hypothetical protein